ncbi:MAG: DUF5606 domain-containing protein [Bacteroidia bacterium]
MSINIVDVVSLAGAPGLHQVVKKDERAIVIESIDERKKRQLVKGSMMLSKLSDITMYTDDDDDDATLPNIFLAIKEKYNTDLPVTKKSKNDDLMNFLGEVLPKYDKERVYPSNVKKLISWFHILNENGIDLVVKEEEEEVEEKEDDKKKDAKKKDAKKKDDKKKSDKRKGMKGSDKI